MKNATCKDINGVLVWPENGNNKKEIMYNCMYSNLSCKSHVCLK